jgi:hypothetical protein
MAYSLYSFSLGLPPFFVIRFSPATVAGILGFFDPLELLVREGVIYSLIKFTMPVGFASLVTLISRVRVTGGGFFSCHSWPFFWDYGCRLLAEPPARKSPPAGIGFVSPK